MSHSLATLLSVFLCLSFFFAGYFYASLRWGKRLVTERQRKDRLLQCLLTVRSKLMGMGDAIDQAPYPPLRGQLKNALLEIAQAAAGYVVSKDETALRASLGADVGMARHFELRESLATAKPQPDSLDRPPPLPRERPRLVAAPPRPDKPTRGRT